MEKPAALFFLLFLGGMIALYGACTEYRPPVSALDTATRVQARYPYYQDVHVMVFVGFAFLFSFLNRNSFTATGHVFLVACYAVLWAMLNRGFWARAVLDDANSVWDRVQITVEALIGADFCAFAVLISFGALMGRLTASQLLLMAIIEVIVYSINEAVIRYRFHAADVGGSMIIHTFGAYFGLACSLMVEKTQTKQSGRINFAGSTRVTDTMAMVGTLFLFCFWPSFNSAFAGLDVQDRAVVNTLLSIATSCITAFLICCLVDVRGKFGMVEVQNATIVGGVAMGAAADMVVNPFGAMCVGMFASMVSVLGYRFVTPALERAGLRDTIGIHNLFGLPGIIGGIVSAIAAGAARFGSYYGTYDQVAPDPSQSRSTQAGYQIAAVALSLGMGLVGGVITGLIIARLPSLPAFFEDVYEYIVPEEHHTQPADQATLSADPAVAEAQRLAPAITPTNATGAPSATEHGASHAHTKALEHVQMNSTHPYPAVVGDNVAARGPTPSAGVVQP